VIKNRREHDNSRSLWILSPTVADNSGILCQFGKEALKIQKFW